MKRLPRGTLTPYAKKTGLSLPYLSEIAAARRRPGRERALALSHAAKAIGKDIPPATWLYGSKEVLRAALTADAIDPERA